MSETEFQNLAARVYIQQIVLVEPGSATLMRLMAVESGQSGLRTPAGPTWR